MSKYVCSICGYIYDEEKGIPEAGIAPGTKWESIPDDMVCPLCGASKSEFMPLEAKESKASVVKKEVDEIHEEIPTEMSFAQMSALCSNLKKGCDKQYLKEEASLFEELANYYNQRAEVSGSHNFNELLQKVNENLATQYPNVDQEADKQADRGALRALVWSEKVTHLLNSILVRYEKEKDALLERTNIYVCEICGFIFIGDVPPDICPICKVPNKKLTKIERG